jgi:transposase
MKFVGKVMPMMGRKHRCFAPIVQASLEDLVPHDHFYRQLDRTLDLSFMRETVQKTYAIGGRPSIDPVVFFKLQLVMFFEGIRSERQLMRHAADRLSIRWFIGYDLGEPLPDHSSLTRIRERYGVEVFRRFFEQIVEQCQAEGLVWGKELYFDGTKVQANASVDSLKPRFFVEAHLESLFGTAREEAAEETDQIVTQEQASDELGKQEEKSEPLPLPTLLSVEEQKQLVQHNAERHDWIEQLGAQNRKVTHRCYQRMADLCVSTTDPDATLMQTKQGVDMGYHTHYVVDGGKARIILNVLVTPSEVMDNQPMLDLLWRVRFRWKLWPRQVTGDKKYGTEDNLIAIEHQHIRAYIPIPDVDHRTEFFSIHDFTYVTERDVYVCPAGKELTSLPGIPRSVLCATELIQRTAITVRSKPSVPPASKVAASAAVWMNRAWNGCVPINKPSPTKKLCGSVRSGWNPYLLRVKTGMACAVFACVGSGGSIVRHSCEQRDKI